MHAKLIPWRADEFKTNFMYPTSLVGNLSNTSTETRHVTRWKVEFILSSENPWYDQKVVGNGHSCAFRKISDQQTKHNFQKQSRQVESSNILTKGLLPVQVMKYTKQLIQENSQVREPGVFYC